MNTNVPSAIIADDEAPLRVYLKRQLARLWPELSIIGEAVNGEEALYLIHEYHPDIAFLDIRMPGMTGLDVAADIANDCRIVFVTAYDQYAVQAFEQAAVDYLLKPVTEARLQIAIVRLRSQMASKPPDLSALLQKLSHTLQPAPRHLQWLKVAQGDEINMLSVGEVDYFRAADKYTSVYTNGKEWLVRTPLKELEVSLDSDQFWRIHRSIIVRVDAISRVTRDLAGRYFVELHGYEQQLHISRSHVHLFKQD